MSLANMVFCITGKFPLKRKELSGVIKSHGGEVASSVTAKVRSFMG